jgi:hypothetical protein
MEPLQQDLIQQYFWVKEDVFQQINIQVSVSWQQKAQNELLKISYLHKSQ